MNNKYSYFIKLKQNRFLYEKHEWQINDIKQEKPFFSISDKDNTLQMFIDAILRDATEEATCYMSRSMPTDINLSEVRRALGSSYKCLIKARKENDEFHKTDSLLIINEGKLNNILHVHMVKEPDGFGKWKIYGIERE